MFVACRDYLKKVLRDAGIRREPFTSRKQMKLSAESHLGAVLFDTENLEKDGGKRIYRGGDGRQKRRKKYSREVVFNVVIGEHKIDAVEGIYEKFMECLEDGIYVDGNYVELQPEETDWIDNEDTIIKSRCAVQFKIRCIGGIYRDTGYITAQDVAVSVEKEKEWAEK